MAVVKNRGAGSKAGRWQCQGKQKEVVPLSGHEGAVEFLPTGYCRSQGSDSNHWEQSCCLCFQTSVVPQWALSGMSSTRRWSPRGCSVCTPLPSQPQGLQEAEFLLWMHFCSSSSSLVHQLSNTWPTPPQKRWLYNIYCGLPVYGWKNGKSGKIKR